MPKLLDERIANILSLRYFVPQLLFKCPVNKIAEEEFDDGRSVFAL